MEPQLNRITLGESSARLEPRAMDLLLCLAERHGQVVSRRELVDRVWAAEFIADSTLTHTVAELRKAFRDDSRQPRFIETIPKRGYRLVAPVSTGEASAESGDRIDRRPLAVIVADRVVLDDRAATMVSERFLLAGDREIPLLSSPIIFGRTVDAGIQILAPEISRRHARLELTAEEVVIEDLGSKNGTTVNGLLIEGRRSLKSGDVLGLGPASLVYCHSSNEPTLTDPGD